MAANQNAGKQDALENIVENIPPNVVRTRLTDKYVGHGGIHGVGVRIHNKRPIIYVYLDPQYELHHDLLRDLEADARPYKLSVVKEHPPTTK